MNCIIPFESKVEFNSPVKEICSISLEHEITKNDTELLGNFFVSGTYKEHKLSINTSEFKFTIPFSVEFTNKIDTNTLEFSIDNFTYDLDGESLEVKIDYIVKADDIPEENEISENQNRVDNINVPEEPDILEVASNDSEKINLPNISTTETEIKELAQNQIENKDEILETRTLEKQETVNTENIQNEGKEDKIITNNRDNINPEMLSFIKTDDDYTTYHVHIIKAEETIESIAKEYQIFKDDLLKINSDIEFTENAKILIPLKNE